MQILIDITDWYELIKRDESFIDSQDELIELVADGMDTKEAARIVLVSREEGVAPENVIRSNKSLLHAGTMKNISDIVKSLKRSVMKPDGRLMDVQEFIGRVDRQDENQSYLVVDDPRALKRATSYLLKMLPKHAASRLAVVMTNEGDVSGIIREMIEQLKAMEKELT